MKKIYLNCIYRSNFGDDLLIKTLCDRYNNCQFILLNYENGTKNFGVPNLKIYNFNNFFYRVVRKISKSIFKTRSFLETFFIKKCDAVITIGGSLFMENKKWKIDEDYNKLFYYKINKPYFIIGSNIGPVFSDEYIYFLKENIFKNAVDVCFRDNKSIEYVKDLKNVRCTTDLVFSLSLNHLPKINNKNQKQVFFSIINIKEKEQQLVNPDSEYYENLVCDLIVFFINKGYKVKLSSFCNAEGDMVEIKKILNMVDNSNIDIVNYNGSVEKLINEMFSSDIIVGSRFHANIIGMLLGKVVIPISYNDKTLNMLNDINFNGVIYDLNKKDKFNPELLDLNYVCNISEFKKISNNSFKEIDKFIND